MIRRTLAIAAATAAVFVSGASANHSLSHLKPYQVRAKQAIMKVFGPYGRQAVLVAWCESRLTRTASNGQYLGIFQMGSSERRIYGHGPGSYAQARAAHRYFVLSGRDWSPWACKPW